MPETADIHINLAPPLTKSQLAKNAEFQAELALQFTPPTNQNDYTQRFINDHLRLLEMLREKYLATDDRITKVALVRRSDSIKSEICLWLVQIGEFQKAVELCPDATTKKLYQRYLKAENAEDDKWCRHSRLKEVNGKQMPNFFREFDYLSQKKGKQLTMLKCGKCEFRNATDTPEDLLKMDAEHAKIVEKAK
jgi:hypothetical protein